MFTIYPHVGVEDESTFRNVNEMKVTPKTTVWIFPETGVNLANLITEAEKVESVAQESSEFIWYSK